MDDKTRELIDEAILETEKYVNEKLAQNGYVLLSEAYEIFKERLGIATHHIGWSYPDDSLSNKS